MVLDARSIPGTPLAVVMMSRMEYGAERREGVRLSVVDADCSDVWSREWPADYVGIERFSPWTLPTREILHIGSAGFSFGSYAEQSRTSFTVAQDPAHQGAWNWGIYEGDGYSIEFNMGTADAIDTIMLHVRGGGNAIAALLQFAQPNNWSLFDCSTSEFLDPENPSSEGWEGFQEYRDKVVGKKAKKKNRKK
jgi:hypothetical protein